MGSPASDRSFTAARLDLVDCRCNSVLLADLSTVSKDDQEF